MQTYLSAKKEIESSPCHPNSQQTLKDRKESLMFNLANLIGELGVLINVACSVLHHIQMHPLSEMNITFA